VEVRIVTEDVPQMREVDLKLIELARRQGYKLATNDGNLGKLAQLQQVPVLNLNELVSALRPVVLAGETMQVVIVREGKEAEQGVGYLDDGTMVVVDHARRMISRHVDITVTSVLQTTAGKMIFGRLAQAEPVPVGASQAQVG
ncbi:MAG: TRAM domain-containing protein, partial [Rhodanobacteraceae bacterium]